MDPIFSTFVKVKVKRDGRQNKKKILKAQNGARSHALNHSSPIYAEVIANKSFSTGKPLSSSP